MDNVFRLVGPSRAVEILGVKLVGVNAENGKKLLFTLVFIFFILLLGRLLQSATRVLRWTPSPRPKNGDPSLLSRQPFVAPSP